MYTARTPRKLSVTRFTYNTFLQRTTVNNYLTKKNAGGINLKLLLIFFVFVEIKTLYILGKVYFIHEVRTAGMFNIYTVTHKTGWNSVM